MFKPTAETIKKIKKPWLIALVLAASASLWVLVFYCVSRTPPEYSFFVWVGSPVGVNQKLTDGIESVCRESGMKKVTVGKYNPADSAYAAAFALQSESVDVYILKRTDAADIMQADIFLDLGEKYKDREHVLMYGDKLVGVRFKEDYYVLVCVKSNKDSMLLFKVVDTIVDYGESV